MTQNIIGRVCIRKSDSKLIEFQSGQDKHSRKVLEQNAINAGYDKNEIQEEEITAEEYTTILSLQPTILKPAKKIKLKDPQGNITEYEIVD
jgi:hypothetical protein